MLAARVWVMQAAALRAVRSAPVADIALVKIQTTHLAARPLAAEREEKIARRQPLPTRLRLRVSLPENGFGISRNFFRPILAREDSLRCDHCCGADEFKCRTAAAACTLTYPFVSCLLSDCSNSRTRASVEAWPVSTAPRN
jgi:hypothetical protein